MSEEYRLTWCPVCEKNTCHEDGVCMECGKLPLESVKDWEIVNIKEEDELGEPWKQLIAKNREEHDAN